MAAISFMNAYAALLQGIKCRHVKC